MLYDKLTTKNQKAAYHSVKNEPVKRKWNLWWYLLLLLVIVGISGVAIFSLIDLSK